MSVSKKLWSAHYPESECPMRLAGLGVAGMSVSNDHCSSGVISGSAVVQLSVDDPKALAEWMRAMKAAV